MHSSMCVLDDNTCARTHTHCREVALKFYSKYNISTLIRNTSVSFSSPFLCTTLPSFFLFCPPPPHCFLSDFLFLLSFPLFCSFIFFSPFFFLPLFCPSFSFFLLFHPALLFCSFSVHHSLLSFSPVGSSLFLFLLFPSILSFSCTFIHHPSFWSVPCYLPSLLPRPSVLPSWSILYFTLFLKRKSRSLPGSLFLL